MSLWANGPWTLPASRHGELIICSLEILIMNRTAGPRFGEIVTSWILSISIARYNSPVMHEWNYAPALTPRTTSTPAIAVQSLVWQILVLII